MTLDSELRKYRSNVRSSGFSMSIGELVSLYRSGELVIDPIFQRHFRWKRPQQISFIESILLEFPLPAIFVVTRSDGGWDLLDGLQRLATILEFMGLLRDPNDSNKVLPPLVLSATEMLPSLEGVVFGTDGEQTDKTLPSSLRIDFRRQKIDVKILLSETADDMILQLFTRLNGGSSMTSQEVRNAVINKTEVAFWLWFERIFKAESFQATLALSDRDILESYNAELALRLIALSKLDGERKDGEEVETFLNRIVRPGPLYELDRDEIAADFEQYFNIVSAVAGSDAFQSKGRGFDVTAFDQLAVTHFRKGRPFEPEAIEADFKGRQA